MSLRRLLPLLAVLGLSLLPTQLPAQKLINGYEPKWWKEAVVYQIYPRSFKDSNGDGIGDLPGITSKLDYLKQLGVNVIWLSPHFDSPNADNGYDIRDYRKVMTEFGTMADFDRMLAGVRQRHMRLIIDLVVNHTSDEHHWFVESRKSLNTEQKPNPYRDYYIWQPGKVAADGTRLPPNNYPSYFSGSAWQYDAATDQYYLHYFATKQPDLNWANPKVRSEVFDLMRFWLDKGVSGFRMDVIPLISKPDGLPDLTPAQLENPSLSYANGPHLTEYLQQMNREVLARYDSMTVGEALGISLAQTASLVDSRRHELNMIFNFDAIRIGRGDTDVSPRKPFSLTDLKAIYTAHAEQLTKFDWDTVFLSNHDNPRLVSAFGNDTQFRVPSAKLLETMILTLRGTAFLYQGDELGMTNYPFKKIEDYDDIAVKNAYQELVATGKIPEKTFLAGVAVIARDNSRTPMQWDATANGGFTTGPRSWLAVNPNCAQINAAQEATDPASVLNYTRKLIALRAKTPAFVYGDYLDLDPKDPHVFAYSRTLGNDKYVVVENFSSEAVTYRMPGGLKLGRLLIDNYPMPAHTPDELKLKPWEARIYKQ